MDNIDTLAEFTIEENLAYLAHSDLPSIIVEGKGDVIIYRQIENIHDVNILAVDGRKMVLNIFKEKQNNQILPDNKIVFIADKDDWVNFGIPDEYIADDLIFTDGYSIENEIFCDYDCEKILRLTDKTEAFNNDLSQFITWYALALQAKQNNGLEREQSDSAPPIHNNRNLTKNPQEIKNNFTHLVTLLPNEVYPSDVQQQIVDNYSTHLRGKSLLAVFTHVCKEHNEKAMFQKVAIDPKEKILAIFSKVKKQLDNN